MNHTTSKRFEFACYVLALALAAGTTNEFRLIGLIAASVIVGLGLALRWQRRAKKFWDKVGQGW